MEGMKEQIRKLPLHVRLSDLLSEAKRHLTGQQRDSLDPLECELDAVALEYHQALSIWEKLRDDPLEVSAPDAKLAASNLMAFEAEVHRAAAKLSRVLATELSSVRMDQADVHAAKKKWQQTIKKTGVAMGQFEDGITIKQAAEQGIYLKDVNHSPVVRKAFTEWQRECQRNRVPEDMAHQANKLWKQAQTAYLSYVSAQHQQKEQTYAKA